MTARKRLSWWRPSYRRAPAGADAAGVAPGVAQASLAPPRRFRTIGLVCGLALLTIPDFTRAARSQAAPAVTTFRQNNHSVRTETWRYTRYADGGEELYDEATDPYEWANLAWHGGGDKTSKDRLGQFLPRANHPPAKAVGPDRARESGGRANQRNNRSP